MSERTATIHLAKGPIGSERILAYCGWYVWARFVTEASSKASCKTCLRAFEASEQRKAKKELSK